LCKKSNSRNSWRISQTQRDLFGYYWNEISWDQRKVYRSTNAEKLPVKRKTTTSEESRRQGTFVYNNENINNRKLQVCGTMFLNTFYLGYKTIQGWVNNSNCGMHQHSEQKKVRQSLLIRRSPGIDNIDKFLYGLPMLPSHYSRKTCSTLFLEPMVSVY
jgi:hypothetical protein